jgi:triosephosphate isomerase
MTPGIRPLVAGNWKMNGIVASLNELRAIGHGFMSGLDAETDALICPPATLLTRAVEVLSTTPVKVGGQDIVRAKAEAAWRAGIVAIICVGETRTERELGLALDILSRQIAGSVPPAATGHNTVIAYEPVWAIGTGLTPTAADVAEAHAHIRAELKELLGAESAHTRILYGGSVKPANAAELLAVNNVDGALVGGASLKAADFLGIAEAYRSI